VADEPEIWIDPSLRAGEWANHVRVIDGEYHFVIDFASRDPLDPDEATLVARVVLPTDAAANLQRELENAWQRYTRRKVEGGPE